MDEQYSVYLPGRNEGGLRDSAAIPTLEEILYAERLRLQIRSDYERRALPPTAVFWSIGVD